MTAPRAIVGVISKALGLKGEVFVRPDPDVAHDFAAGDTFVVTGGRELVVAAARSHSGRLVVRFAGVETREQAEQLRGLVLEVSREDVALDDDTFWNDELLGRQVVDDHGELVGVLEATMDGAAHDYLVVARPDGAEILIPAVAELVDVQPERIVVRAIPGLLDADEPGPGGE
jgi:16S rRNA processing protein RimM